MAADQNKERRSFVRVPFHSQVLLKQAGVISVCRLLDLSLKGILLEVPQDWESGADKNFEIELSLSPSGDEDVIGMKVSLAHREKRKAGFRWESIDLDSFAHLKRLLEMNLGDEDELNREIHSLSDKR